MSVRIEASSYSSYCPDPPSLLSELHRFMTSDKVMNLPCDNNFIEVFFILGVGSGGGTS